MTARNGKIARLPRNIREDLNQRLERSEPGPQLLAWLNALKEVKRILKDEFGGVPISKQNLCEWRQGGFQEWLVRQEIWAKVGDMEDFARELGEERDNVVADDVATVLAAHYAALISTWNGQPDAKFEAAARVLNGLCRGVVQLQRGMHWAERENEEVKRRLEDQFEQRMEKLKKKQLNQVWSMLREPQVAQAFGGGELGRKLAKFIIQVENDVPGARLELTGDEKCDPLEPAAKEAERVKPTRKQRTAQRARKARPATVHKPLQKNKLEGAKGRESSQDQSDPVKPGQTGSNQFSAGERFSFHRSDRSCKSDSSDFPRTGFRGHGVAAGGAIGRERRCGQSFRHRLQSIVE